MIITLKPDTMNSILQSLGKNPYNKVHGVIDSIGKSYVLIDDNQCTIDLNDTELAILIHYVGEEAYVTAAPIIEEVTKSVSLSN